MVRASAKQVKRTAWGWGRKQVPTEDEDIDSHESFPWWILYVGVTALPAVATWAVREYVFNDVLGTGELWTYAALLPIYGVLAAAIGLPFFAFLVLAHSRWTFPSSPCDNQSKYFTFKDERFQRKWEGRKIPIEDFYEAYFAEKIDVKGDLLETLYFRKHFVVPRITMSHVSFFVWQLIPELLSHTRQQDVDQVRGHYDRGDDFYAAFLGPTMIYTSGIFNDLEETLEEAQRNKLDIVCNKIHMVEGDRHLDLGCGWGTLIVHAAKNFGTKSIGITLGKNQTAWANALALKEGVEDRAVAMCMDYRDVPEKTEGIFDKITCLEMSEHVGVKNYRAFCKQVYSMLTDDGMFYLQIAGLRRPWQYEDLTWGMFMAKYVFPGADASCPLGWVINHLEAAGFEVRSEETIGTHYSATIKRWYDNWITNKDYIQEKYGERWFRCWAWFLAWSVLSPESGMATCYQIVLHKNTNFFDRKQFVGERRQWRV